MPRKKSTAFEDGGYDPLEDVVRYRNLLLEELAKIEAGGFEVSPRGLPFAYGAYTRPYDEKEMRAHLLAELARLGERNMNYRYAKKAAVSASGPGGGPIELKVTKADLEL